MSDPLSNLTEDEIYADKDEASIGDVNECPNCGGGEMCEEHAYDGWQEHVQQLQGDLFENAADPAGERPD